MRTQTLKTMMVISILMILSALSVNAQKGSGFVVKVPFAFTLSGKTLPAGEYVFARSAQASSEVIRIRSKERGAFVQTKLVQAQDIQEESQVIFKRYGDQYFLFQIWTSGKSSGRELFKSAQEQKSERELAQRAIKPETVAIMVQPR
jgi:hypothetical protein